MLLCRWRIQRIGPANIVNACVLLKVQLLPQLMDNDQ
jgi:hypothetical protein